MITLQQVCALPPTMTQHELETYLISTVLDAANEAGVVRKPGEDEAFKQAVVVLCSRIFESEGNPDTLRTVVLLVASEQIIDMAARYALIATNGMPEPK